jgi:D-glycero-D-manno-heptose 1,7-bisphosphate phosphatase
MTEAALEDIHGMMQERLAEEGCAFEAIFAYTGAAADGVGAKPDPHFIHLAAERLGLDLGASWLVGDADRDIEMGRRAGLRTIRVGRHGPMTVDADHSVDDVAEVAGILRSP